MDHAALCVMCWVAQGACAGARAHYMQGKLKYSSSREAAAAGGRQGLSWAFSNSAATCAGARTRVPWHVHDDAE
jgi:hypothetical protein